MRQAFEFVFLNYDNTSATSVKVIGFKVGKKNSLCLGDLALVVPKKHIKTKEIQKKKKLLGLVVGLKASVKRKNGNILKSYDNKILLLNHQFKFLGTRVYGGICKEARGGYKETLFKKIITLSGGAF